MTVERNSPHDDADCAGRDLASALRLLGLGMPETEAEVAAAESWLAQHPVVLPDSLRDPDAVLRKGAGEARNVRLLGTLDTTEAAENLARAARDGKAIPEEIERRMREDREREERERRE